MKINKLKINAYGKLYKKEIELKDGINIIYGKNEAGKSTLINFITSSFYGISKNKNGKEITDFEKYKPWAGHEFSGKIEYTLTNNKKYEIYRDFYKKNPKIYNQNLEDITNEFEIDKTKGNRFFYEQTGIDKDLFLSTLAINQNEVKLNEQNQNMVIQKVANLAETGEDSKSFKKVFTKLNKMQLDKIGSERSREKPINIVSRNIEELKKQQENLEKFKTTKIEIEKEKKELNTDITSLELEIEYLKKLKSLIEEEHLEKEKIKIKETITENNLRSSRRNRKQNK